MDGVRMPEYKIGSHLLRLRKYGELKGKEENYISESLGLSSTSNEIKITIERDKLFPVMLEPVGAFDINEVEWEELTSDNIVEIITDFIAEKESFLAGMGERIKSSLNQKIGQKKNL